MSNLLKICQMVAEILRFCRFPKVAAAILDFQKFKFLRADTFRRQICVIVLNFIKISRSVANIRRFFKWRPSAMLDPICVRLPNFITIGQSVAKIWRIFKKILKNWKFPISQQEIGRSWWNSAGLRRFGLPNVPTVKNWNFWKYKMAAAAILETRKITISPQPRHLTWWRALVLLIYLPLFTKLFGSKLENK